MTHDMDIKAYHRKLALLRGAFANPDYDFLPYADVDLKAYGALLQDQSTDKAEHYSMEELAEIVAFNRDLGQKDGRYYKFFIRPKGEACYVGEVDIRLQRGSKTLDIGYYVVHAARNQGVATRLCTLVCTGLENKAAALGIRTISAETYPENGASQRVLEKAGFTHQGIGPTSFTTNIDGSALDYAGKQAMHYSYSLERGQQRKR